MSFTNINDPAGVKALLDQLRSSPAWQETISPPNQGDTIDSEVANPSSSSVAALLSQLQDSTASRARNTPDPSGSTLPRTPSEPAVRTKTQDVRSLTSQQSLPHLARLSGDPTFVSSINQVKQEQADLEQKLWSERQAINMKFEEKVNVSRTKANMIGAGGLSRNEAEALSDACRKELHEFDMQRVLPAWDNLITKQQIALERQAVPTMCVTTARSQRETQQRVIKILEGIIV